MGRLYDEYPERFGQFGPDEFAQVKRTDEFAASLSAAELAFQENQISAAKTCANCANVALGCYPGEPTDVMSCAKLGVREVHGDWTCPVWSERWPGADGPVSAAVDPDVVAFATLSAVLSASC